MGDLENPTTKKLLKALMQLRKNNWHEKRIAGFRPSELKVLMTIRHETRNEKSEMKVSEISKSLRVTSPTVTQIINDLEKQGLVIREIDPEDRRAVKIKLTVSGEDIAIKAEKEFTDAISGLIDFLGEEDSEHLVELLSKVYEYFNHLHS